MLSDVIGCAAVLVSASAVAHLSPTDILIEKRTVNVLRRVNFAIVVQHTCVFVYIYRERDACQ